MFAMLLNGAHWQGNSGTPPSANHGAPMDVIPGLETV
jgi:hypothetical protein